MRRGFTLAEVVVALVLLEVGLLGVVGTVVLASSILTRVEDRERALGHAGLLLDSLARGGHGPDSGLREEGWGTVAWRVDGDRGITLRVVPRSGRAWTVEGGVVPDGGGGR